VSDVAAFSKLPEVFGFAIEYTDPEAGFARSPRLKVPSCKEIVVGHSGSHWLIETKGHETPEVQRKDEAAQCWCEDAAALTTVQWRYLNVPQKQFEQLQAATLADLVVTSGSLL
jgi:hypothetical protein